MTRRRFLLWLAGLMVCNAALWYGIVNLGFWPVVRSFLGEYTPSMFLFAWLILFPALRYCLRSRLRKRQRLLIWAEIPGVVSLIGTVLLEVVVLSKLLGSFVALAILSEIGTVFFEIAVLVMIGLGLVAGLVLIVECLRPDRVVDEPDVFE